MSDRYSESRGKYSTVRIDRLTSLQRSNDDYSATDGTARLDKSKGGFVQLDVITGNVISPIQWIIINGLCWWNFSFNGYHNGTHRSPQWFKQWCSLRSQIIYRYIRVPSTLFAGSLKGAESIGKSPSSGACRSSVRCRQDRREPAMNWSHKCRIIMGLRRVCS